MEYRRDRDMDNLERMIFKLLVKINDLEDQLDEENTHKLSNEAKIAQLEDRVLKLEGKKKR